MAFVMLSNPSAHDLINAALSLWTALTKISLLPSNMFTCRRAWHIKSPAINHAPSIHITGNEMLVFDAHVRKLEGISNQNYLSRVSLCWLCTIEKDWSFGCRNETVFSINVISGLLLMLVICISPPSSHYCKRYSPPLPCITLLSVWLSLRTLLSKKIRWEIDTHEIFKSPCDWDWKDVQTKSTACFVVHHTSRWTSTCF